MSPVCGIFLLCLIHSNLHHKHHSPDICGPYNVFLWSITKILQFSILAQKEARIATGNKVDLILWVFLIKCIVRELARGHIKHDFVCAYNRTF